MKNTLYFGDNLDWLPKIDPASVDLIYLDPPFNSKANYNLLYKSPEGSAADAQYHAFQDSWRWGSAANRCYHTVLSSGSPAAEILVALRNFMHESDMMAYLAMMTARLIEMHRLLKPTGCLYLHCDPTASHYLKILLDGIFGGRNFRTEIIWKRSSAHSDTKQGRRQHGRIHDTILFYSKSDTWSWNPIYTEYDQNYIDSFYKSVEPGTGRRYQLGDLTGPGGEAKGNPRYEVMGVTRYWRYSEEKMAQLIAEGRVVQTKPGATPRYKRYLDEMPGVPLQDIWTDLSPIGSHAKEWLPYPTQKPLSLLERITKSSSSRGDVILDPFCGCGSAIEAAARLGRHWIGIDVTVLALDVVERRLGRWCGLRRGIDYEVMGIPRDTTSAKSLCESDAHDFQLWALTLVDAQPRDGGKKGADAGVDGIIYFQDSADSTGRAVVSVKGGENINPSMIRDLIGTVGNQRAKVGIFVTLTPPTRKMQEAADAAGLVEAGGRLISRIQIRTIGELLAKHKPDLPPVYDVLAAASAARIAPRRPTLPPTPDELRRSPQFPPMPLPGGKIDKPQRSLSLDEPLLISTRGGHPTKRGVG
jgi:DNA modification methylase